MTNNTSICSRDQLLQKISEVSFAVNDIHLFLDTHPHCEEALKYYQEMAAERKKYMKLYAENYGPLTADDALCSSTHCWKWSKEAFPWEKGAWN